MILDTGICSVFRKTDVSGNGDMPYAAYTPVCRSWYGNLAYETSPARPTDGRTERKTDARVRILQHREIAQYDVAVLYDLTDFAARDTSAPVYKITRAYHGQDDGGPTLISDLSLEVFEP